MMSPALGLAGSVAVSQKPPSPSGVSPVTPCSVRLLATATDPANPNAGDIIDYRHGTFTSQPAPAPHGYTGAASGIVAVPGTGSFWAAGMLTAVKGGTSETDILRYSP